MSRTNHRAPAADAVGRLHLARIAAELRITVAAMARAAGVSETAMRGVVRHDRWPVRVPADQIRLEVAALCQRMGATERQLSLLWQHADGTPPAAQATADSPDSNPQEDLDMLLPKQTLSASAARHFKLFRNPFDGEVTRDEQFFCGDDIRYVREAAWQCARNSGFVAIVGESGAGKTTVLGDLEARLQVDPQGVIVIKPGVLGLEQSNNSGQVLKATDILHAVVTTLDPTATVPQTLQARTVKATKLLAASAQTGNTHLVVIEEAHSLPNETLKHLKRLHELRNGRRGLLGILLLAQPELRVRLEAGLRSGSLREVAQRCEMVELLPLDADLRAYLELRAAAVNVDLDAIIEPKAVDQLRTRLTRKTSGGAMSMCYPLAVNNMVTRAMNSAAELGVPVVNRDVVNAV